MPSDILPLPPHLSPSSYSSSYPVLIMVHSISGKDDKNSLDDRHRSSLIPQNISGRIYLDACTSLCLYLHRNRSGDVTCLCVSFGVASMIWNKRGFDGGSDRNLGGAVYVCVKGRGQGQKGGLY